MPQYKRKLKKGLRWYYKFDFQGRTYHSQAIYHTQYEAKKAESLKYSLLETEQRRVNKVEMTLLELINERLDFVKAAKSVKYYKESRHYLNILLNRLGNISVYEISKGDIQKLLINESKTLRKVKKDNYAVNALLRSCKALFNYGISYLNLEIHNPCFGVSFFPIQKKVKYIPTDEEIQQVLQKCNPDQKLLVEFVRDTGARISEALNMRRRDVFDGYVVLHTRKSKSSNLTPRKVKFDTSKLILPDSNDERVFATWSDLPKFLSKKTRRKWNWHNLRHRYASKLSQKGIPIFEIMCLLGHNNIETTQNYLQLLSKSEKQKDFVCT